MKTLLVILGLLTCATVALADDCAPARVTNLAAATYYASIRLTWSDSGVGDDCGTGTPSTWEMRISTSPITNAATWCSASAFASGDLTDDGCAAYTGTCPGAQTRYFALVYYDEAGNRSPIATVTGSTRALFQVVQSVPEQEHQRASRSTRLEARWNQG